MMVCDLFHQRLLKIATRIPEITSEPFKFTVLSLVDEAWEENTMLLILPRKMQRVVKFGGHGPFTEAQFEKSQETDDPLC